MSDTNKNFKLIKTTVNDVLFILRPVSNPNVARTIHLTKRNPQQVLPLDWALGVFQDSGIYSMYRKGLITFENNEDAVKAAYENGVYFSDELDFEPAPVNQAEVVCEIIKSGNRKNILDAIEKYGRDTICQVASANVADLSTGVVSMLENILKVQLTLDEDVTSDVE